MAVLLNSVVGQKTNNGNKSPTAADDMIFN
jgi:hypothetical protein